jgi:hypothetical protein
MMLRRTVAITCMLTAFILAGCDHDEHDGKTMIAGTVVLNH